ncbi:FecR domain-containing protein [Bradyrhizobium sp.]|uniref:FecR domain-containing protein n=1 Tax=Bradyrhizobium sp. TaxID=376 RepID=UPI0040379DA5
MTRRQFSFALLLVAGLVSAHVARAESGSVQIAQAQPGPPIQTPAGAAPLPTAPAPAAETQTADAPEEPIGNVASLTGKASVKRNDKSIPLALKDDIFLNDVVQTAASSTLGITFSDGTTFNLKASSEIAIDDFVYEEGGKKNAGVFDVARGTVAFVAAQVAKTGDMQITTPTATLGIRGTSGLVEVPAGVTATSASNVNIKLYPDADGRVGRIEVNDRAGARLGFLSQGASGFAIRPGAGGARFAAVPIAITPQMMRRDQGFVRQVHSMQTFGRRVFDEQRAFRRANPGLLNPNRPIRQPGQLRGPGQLRRDGVPGQNRPGQPGLQDRRGQQQPGAPGRQGLRQPGSPQQAGQPPRPGQPGQLGRPGRQQQGQPGQQTGQPPGGLQRPGLPRPGQTPGTPGQVGSPTGAPQQGAPIGRPVPGGPAGPPPVNQPRLQQPGPGGAQPVPQQGGQLRQGGVPGLRQPGLPGRPALQQPRRTAPVQAPPKGRKPPDQLR